MTIDVPTEWHNEEVERELTCYAADYTDSPVHFDPSCEAMVFDEEGDALQGPFTAISRAALTQTQASLEALITIVVSNTSYRRPRSKLATWFDTSRCLQMECLVCNLQTRPT